MQWLIALKSTSGEGQSSRFNAVSAAAARLAEMPIPDLNGDAAVFYRDHGELLTRFVQAQLETTQELLAGMTEVVLHRGDAIEGDLPSSPTNPNLWPLASFATDFATADEFARRAARGKGGTPVVYSAIVPVARIAATPKTGAANAIEHEIVVLASNPDDLATVTVIAPAQPQSR